MPKAWAGQDQAPRLQYGNAPSDQLRMHNTCAAFCSSSDCVEKTQGCSGVQEVVDGVS